MRPISPQRLIPLVLLLGGCSKPDAQWQSDYLTLLNGDVHCPPGWGGTAPDSCFPATGNNPQSGIGASGYKQLSPPASVDLAQVFTRDCTSPDHWNEQWITSDSVKLKTNSEYPMTWSPVSGGGDDHLTQSKIGETCGSSPCWTKYANQIFDYLAVPSQSFIDGLSSSLPSDTIYHQTFLIKSVTGGTGTEAGRLFRVITSTGGVETWHDHWVLFDNYHLVGGSYSAEIRLVTSTSDDEHSPAYGAHPHLKDFLNDLRNDTGFKAATWDYVQVQYTWSSLPGTAPTGCPAT